MAGKYALHQFPPFMLTSLRFAVVALALVPWVRWPKPLSFSKIIMLSFLLGPLNFGAAQAALGWGLDTATTIVLAQLGVPFSCVFGSVLLGDKLGPWRTFGLVVAMTGIVVLAGTPDAVKNFSAFIAMIISGCAWGFANILMKRYGEVKIYSFLGWTSLFSSLQLLFISFLSEHGQVQALQTADWQAICGVLYLGLCCSVAAYGIWYYLLRKYLASQITPYSMLGPFFALGMGKIFLGTTISTQVVVAGLITLLGVGIIVVRRPRLVTFGKVTKHTDASHNDVKDS